MIVMILCFIGYIVVGLFKAKQSVKDLGNPVVITNSTMSSNEITNLSVRGILTVVVAMIVQGEGFIENEYALLAVTCAIALYAGYILFPIICYIRFKSMIGIYEHGIFAYDGIMRYEKMKEYVIDENHNHDRSGQTMTVYCNGTFPLLTMTKHFDIEKASAKNIHSFFKKKHKQIKNIKKRDM